MDQNPQQIDRQTPRTYRPRKKRERDTAERILASAALLMPDQGYDSLKIRDLASHAGIGLGTVYGHFPSKEEIAVQLVTRGVAAVHAGMSILLYSSESEQERLRRLLTARVVLRQQQTRGQRHPINEATPQLMAALSVYRPLWRETERRMLAQAVHEGQVAGRLVYRSFQDIAQTLLWATDGLVAEALGTVPILSAAAVELGVENDFESPADALDILDESRLGSGGLELKTTRVAELLVSGLIKPQDP